MPRSSYIDLVRQLPRPSEPQVDAFVSYVGSAHSWYKHLPLFPPGERFVFFMNPNAGREWIRSEAGGMYRDRRPDAPARDRFHYTWQPTTEYIRCFGYLDYFTAAGTSFLVPMDAGVLDTSRNPRVQAPSGQWVELSEDVRSAGAVNLTASIHPFGQEPAIWLARLGRVELLGWSQDATLPRRPLDDQLLARIVEGLQAIPAKRISRPRLHALTQLRRAWLGRAGQPSAELSENMASLREYIESYAAVERHKMKTAVANMLHAVFP